MTPERWRQIEELYHAVRECGPAALAGADSELRREVERLLAQESCRKILDESPTELMRSLMIAQPPPDVSIALAGQIVSHYQILEMLGAGGMGVVYKAFDTKLNRLVALKFLPPRMRQDPELKRQLTEEARAASALDHPNIVIIYDIDDTGDLFIAMAFHEGVTLREKIAQGLPVKESLQIARQIASGLAKAHEHGIVHRDIKPSNVIVAKDGIARIIDFGLARSSDFTAAGTVMGTPLYMSPEQASGKAVDFRTDLWSLGTVLYEMLTGKLPFDGETQQEVLHAVVHDEPAGVLDVRPDLPPEIAAIVSRALQKEPAARYQSAAELGNDLSAVLISLDAPRGRAGLRPAYAAPAAVLLLLATGMGLWFGRVGNQPAPRVVPLTTFAGNQALPVFSPDGKQVAFTWDSEREDHWNIYLKMIDGATALRLTVDDDAENMAPAWSPDGRRIAFLKLGEGPHNRYRKGLYSISPLGGPQRELADFEAAASRPSWSHDGRFLVAAKKYDEFQPNRGSGALYRIPAEGGEPKPLLTPPPGHWFKDPAVSPSGDSLAFVSCWGTTSAETCDVFVAAITTDLLPQGGPRQITHIATPFEGLAWAADSRSLVYSSRPGGGLSANDVYLWRTAVSAGAAPERLDIASAGAYSPAVALQGNRLAFSRKQADTDIWRVDAGKPARPFLVSSMTDSSPQFSPDGRRIAFSSGRGMDGNHIWLANQDGGEIVQLTAESDTSDGSPRWSPDGYWIAFDVFSKGGARTIKIVEVASRRVRQLTTGPSNSSVPGWSRDGKWVYFRSDRSGHSEIWRMPQEGGTAEQITRHGGYVGLESADGTSLYYTKTGGDGPLFRKILAGDAEERILPRVVSRGFAVFEDGIYYLDSSVDNPGTPERPFEIRFHNFATGENRTVAGGIEADPGLGLSVSRDRTTFLLTLWRNAEDHLMLMENFR